VQLGRVLAGQAHLRPLQQRPRLGLVHRQVGGFQLHHPALPAQRHRQPRSGAAGQRQQRAAGQPHGKLGDHIQARPVVEQLDVVQDQGDRFGHRRHGGGQPGHDRGHNVATRHGEGVEDLGVDRLDAVQRHR
jgi:hypothetical protein